jgi:type VI secretion system secreted protein Hcp
MRHIAIKFLRLLFLACFLIAAGPSWAAYDLFVFVEGIPGESIDGQHEDWIDGLAYHSDSQYDPATRQVSFGDIGMVKKVDRASPGLNAHAASVRRIPRVVFDFVESSGSGQLFLQITLEGVRVKKVAAYGSPGSEYLTERVAFAFERITWEYWPLNGDPVKLTWDALRNCESVQHCKADFDVEGDVDGVNLATFLFAFGSAIDEPNYYPPADMDNDNRIDEDDLAEFALEFSSIDCITCGF